MQLDFSVIIPVYNVENYLLESVQSVLKQNYSSLEIILIDDGSTDSSGAICDQIANDYEVVSVIHQKNQGLSSARNAGIRNASGQYVILLDSDDTLSDNSLEKLKQVIVRYHNPDFIISRIETILSDGNLAECKYRFPIEKLKTMSISEIYAEIQNYPDMYMGAWIFTVSVQYLNKKKLLFCPGLLHEDEEWVPRVFFGGGSIAFNNSPLYIYTDQIGRVQ